MLNANFGPACFGYNLRVDTQNKSGSNEKALQALQNKVSALEVDDDFKATMEAIETEKVNGNRHFTLDLVLSCPNIVQVSDGQFGVKVGRQGAPVAQQQLVLFSAISTLKNTLLEMAGNVAQFQPFQGTGVLDDMRTWKN